MYYSTAVSNSVETSERWHARDALRGRKAEGVRSSNRAISFLPHDQGSREMSSLEEVPLSVGASPWP